MNDNIIEQFKLLTKQIKFDIDMASNSKQQLINMYRLGAIQKVVKILEKYKKKITSSEQLKDIKGVGTKSLLRIDEILKTGKLSEIKITGNINKYLDIIASLEDVFGIGRKTAYDLFKKYKITSINDLQKKYDNGDIDLPPNIIKGLKYVDQLKEHIPRKEIDELYVILTNALFALDPQLFGVVCGSYRRQLLESGDVDFIIVHSDIKTKKDAENINYIEKLVTLLKNKNIIIDSLTGDDVKTKYMGIFRINDYPLRRLDIRYMPYESFYSAILYFTGAKDFNRKMRQIALNMGYTLNEYGLYDENKNMFKVSSEKEIFELLNMEYMPPDKRI
jgi:DNA polymerase/3'-5' exonuclease PolX